MNNITTKLVTRLANNESITEIFRSELELAVNTLLKTELTSFLDYEKYDRAGFNSGNSRNGFYSRNLDTEYGSLSIEIPRDRNGDFNQKLIPSHQRRTGYLEEMIINLYQTGMTTSEISKIVEKLYGHHYSKQTVSNISEQLIENISAFKNRPLKKQYSVIYMDATHLSLRRDTVQKEAVHIVIGIDIKGNKEVLGYKIAPQESSFIWHELLQDIHSRGCEEVLLCISDGLTGIEDVIHKTFPKSDIQRCIVHIGRNIASKVRVKDRREILDDFKKVYRAETHEKAKEQLSAFIEKWEKSYKKMTTLICNQKYLLTFYKYPKEIRASIYTTNLIEGFNKQLKRKSKRKEQFPNEESLEKFLVTIFSEYNSQFGSRIHKGFGLVEAELTSEFEKRYY
jgi:transposase-like protein